MSRYFLQSYISTTECVNCRNFVCWISCVSLLRKSLVTISIQNFLLDFTVYFKSILVIQMRVTGDFLSFVGDLIIILSKLYWSFSKFYSESHNNFDFEYIQLQTPFKIFQFSRVFLSLYFKNLIRTILK